MTRAPCACSPPTPTAVGLSPSDAEVMTIVGISTSSMPDLGHEAANLESQDQILGRSCQIRIAVRHMSELPNRPG
jgi:hypothetical protein